VSAAGDTRPVLLLTGFGPFPGVPHNASADLVKGLAAAAVKRFPKKCVVAHIFPTEWVAAERQLTNLFTRHSPALAVHFGVSAQARGFCIETTAHNAQAPVPDAAGRLPASPKVLASGAGSVPVSIPAAKIFARLERLAVPASLSHTAGTYLCNSVMYRSVHLAEQTAALAGFIHLPVQFDAPQQGKFDFETAVAGGIEIIRTCLGLAPPARTLHVAVNQR
jgi:pyroglutamyl-peptidase